MSSLNEIRADYSGQTITIYQAYSAAIAKPALQGQRFVSPFSFTRMTWIKPSFLWLMERSNWGQKSGQEYILAVHVKRSGWDEALSSGVLTSFEASAYRNAQTWREQFEHEGVKHQPSYNEALHPIPYSFARASFRLLHFWRRASLALGGLHAAFLVTLQT